jgi:spore cortex formation protein SpoVR/YcgB (stage V sporulation)
MTDMKETEVAPTQLEMDIREMAMWDKRMARAAKRYKNEPFEIIYRLISDETMLDLQAYEMMMPTDIPYWVHGKRAQQARQNARGFHVFEAALNLNPAIVWLALTNDMPMQVNVMAHAVYGHVSLCKLNFLFPETGPETALLRFAQYREKTYKLVRDSRWGWEGVEYILDAAHALQHHSGWLPTPEGRLSDEDVRENLENEIETLRERITVEGQYSAAEEKVLRRKLAAAEARLSRNPIRPTNDVLGWLADRRNTPNMSDEARMLVTIVRDRSRYLQPVGRTKIMHEGWSSYWEKKILTAAEVGLPFDFMFDLAKAWSMHDSQVATRFYFDPYAMGVRVWEYIDRKWGFDEGEVEISRPVVKKNKWGMNYESDEIEVVKENQRNHDKMFHVGATYEDTRFLTDFMGEELIERINVEALGWVTRFMTKAVDFLKRSGWGPQVVFDPLPTTLDGLLKVCQVWLNEAQMADYYHEQMGTPRFPVPPMLVQHMVQVLQIVRGYDANKRKLQIQMVRRAGMSFLPNIYVEDDGRATDQVLTLKHVFDPTWGPLLQSECRDTLKYFGRLYGIGRKVRLLTMEIAQDRQGNPVGDPFPYEYLLDKDTVKERRVT